MSYRNSTQAAAGRLSSLLAHGDLIEVRGQTTLEIRNESFTVANPLERFIVLNDRNGSPAAAIAETMWVLAGRDDIEFLLPYLHRADEFSDDGRTWRGAYGPRIRDWYGTDQVDEVIRILRHDQNSRRAVISLFDPSRDFADTKDVPCNNWLQFTIRDGRLNVAVVMRSNDLMWGFTGINAFEWSVLHEFMANWLSVEVGEQAFFVGSSHIYERHFERAKRILAAFSGTTCYELGVSTTRYCGTRDALDADLRNWFQLEKTVREDPGIAIDEAACPDPLFRTFLHAVRAHWSIESGATEESVRSTLRPLAGTDAECAMLEYWSRRGGPSWSAPSPNKGAKLESLQREMSALHSAKSAAYGESWKRRGELVGILGNIARKVDRLERLEAGAPEGDETITETLIDLCVYLIKYQTFLADQDTNLKEENLPSVAGEASTGTMGFERLLHLAKPSREGSNLTALARRFAELEDSATSGSTARARYILAEGMVSDALAHLLGPSHAKPV